MPRKWLRSLSRSSAWSKERDLSPKLRTGTLRHGGDTCLSSAGLCWCMLHPLGASPASPPAPAATGWAEHRLMDQVKVYDVEARVRVRQQPRAGGDPRPLWVWKRSLQSSHGHSQWPRGTEGAALATHQIRSKKGSQTAPRLREAPRAEQSSTHRLAGITHPAWALPLASLKLSSRFKTHFLLGNDERKTTSFY